MEERKCEKISLVVHAHASPSGRSACYWYWRQFAQHITSLPTLLVRTGLVLYKVRCSSGFASLAFARSAQPHCPRQRTRLDPSCGLAISLGQRRRQATVMCNANCVIVGFCSTPGPPAVGRGCGNHKKHEYQCYLSNVICPMIFI